MFPSQWVLASVTFVSAQLGGSTIHGESFKVLMALLGNDNRFSAII